MVDITQMMDVSPEVFYAWRAEYTELFDKLITRLPQPKQPNDVTKTVGTRRIAYISGGFVAEEVESELRACKLKFSVIENAATIAGELLKSGSILGNFQKPSYRKDSSSASSPLHEGSIGGSQMGKPMESASILVSVQVVNQARDPLPVEASAGGIALSGVVSEEIDELRWRVDLADDGQIDEPIISDVSLKFSLDGILDAPIDAIRAFYTSPMDALLLGNFLIKKSNSPT